MRRPREPVNGIPRDMDISVVSSIGDKKPPICLSPFGIFPLYSYEDWMPVYTRDAFYTEDGKGIVLVEKVPEKNLSATAPVAVDLQYIDIATQKVVRQDEYILYRDDSGDIIDTKFRFALRANNGGAVIAVHRYNMYASDPVSLQITCVRVHSIFDEPTFASTKITSTNWELGNTRIEIAPLTLNMGGAVFGSMRYPLSMLVLVPYRTVGQYVQYNLYLIKWVSVNAISATLLAQPIEPYFEFIITAEADFRYCSRNPALTTRYDYHTILANGTVRTDGTNYMSPLGTISSNNWPLVKQPLTISGDKYCTEKIIAREAPGRE